MNTKIFKISTGWATNKGLPTAVAAIKVVETQKAYYLYGHGVKDPLGQCCRCGRTLTHPGSILLGIGPECLNDWGARDIRLDRVTPADQKYLQDLMAARMIDSWIPKTCVEEISDAEKEITLPESHPMINRTAPIERKETAKMAATMAGDKVSLNFSFPKGDERFVKVLAGVKELSGRRWDPVIKSWLVTQSYDNWKAIMALGFHLDEKAKAVYEALTCKNVVKIDDSLLDPRLKEYQKAGVAFLHERQGSALIGDEQGLGKTAQYLSWLSMNPEVRPALVVCPASLKLNWQREIGMWVKTRNRVHIITGKKPSPLPKADIYIINYDILGDAKTSPATKVVKVKGWVEQLGDFGFKSICIDECQRVKSETAARTRASLYLSGKIPARCALSGTPIKNRAVEIFNPINFVNKAVFPSFWKFTEEFTVREHNGFGWTYSGVKNATKLHKILTETIMIRRKKEDVLTELPPKTRATVPMEIVNPKEYRKVMDDFVKWLNGTYKDKAGNLRRNSDNPAARMVEIEKLRQATIAGKIDGVIEWIQDFLEANGKLIVFATHKETLRRLAAAFPDISVTLDGGTNKDDRQSVVDAFQNDPKVRLFLGNIIAAGEGITLTASSDVAFVEYPFCPADCVQAEDRAHRIGQRDNVTCWYLTAAETIEESLVTMLQKKAKTLDQVLDGKDVDDKSIFDEVIAGLKK